MPITLPESTPRRQRSPGVVVLSAVVHAAVIGTTVVATGLSAPRPTTAPPLETLIFVKREPEEAPPLRRVRQVETPPPSDRGVPAVAAVVVPSLELPVDLSVVPTTIPALAETLVGAWEAPGAVASVAGGSPTGNGQGEGAGAAPMRANVVDREVVPRGGVTPQYPTQLANAGIEGTVVAQFVVDTVGRVEPSTIQLSAGSHPLFGQSVREALGRMRFSPAELGGRRVRQLVQQSFAFALTRR
ncbi:MAG: TonB family protein [Gemmatimonadaceae bacterium]|nr:TonB family protein [Gemmatimonadaceae bacterium]